MFNPMFGRKFHCLLETNIFQKQILRSCIHRNVSVLKSKGKKKAKEKRNSLLLKLMFGKCSLFHKILHVCWFSVIAWKDQSENEKFLFGDLTEPPRHPCGLVFKYKLSHLSYSWCDVVSKNFILLLYKDLGVSFWVLVIQNRLWMADVIPEH